MDLDFDVRPYLVSITDMEFFEEDAEQAADHLNAMIYAIHKATAHGGFWTHENIEQLVVEISDLWLREPGLLESDTDELEDYITHLVQRIEQDAESDDSTEVLDEG